MQLILTQSDIETALINYVNELVNIKDGMSITVDLKATRGADGATAIIDISPAKAATAKAEPVVKPQVVTNSKPAQTKPEVKAEPKPEVKAYPKPEVVDDNAGAAAANTAADANADAQAQDTQSNVVDNDNAEGGDGQAGVAEGGEAQAADPVVETPAADGAAKPKSLFEGLRKPKND